MRKDLAVDRASVLAQVGRWDEFERVRAQLGTDPRADMLAGVAAFAKEEWSAACDAYRTVLSKRPDDPAAKSRLWASLVHFGDKAVEDGKFHHAVAPYREAATLFPKATKAHRKLAEVHIARDDLTAAAAVVREAGPKMVGCATVIFRIATAHLKKGDRKAALDALNGALDVEGNAVRVQLEKDPAWAAVRNEPDVVAVLELGQNKPDSN